MVGDVEGDTQGETLGTLVQATEGLVKALPPLLSHKSVVNTCFAFRQSQVQSWPSPVSGSKTGEQQKTPVETSIIWCPSEQTRNGPKM